MSEIGQSMGSTRDGETRTGYARVSTQDQRLAMKRDALKPTGCALLYEATPEGHAPCGPVSTKPWPSWGQARCWWSGRRSAVKGPLRDWVF